MVLPDFLQKQLDSSEYADPVDRVIWVKIKKIAPNPYNPNVVAPNELLLLKHSIEHDGYTQPIVTTYNEERDKYIIVDGFHRYWVMKNDEGIRNKTDGKLPIVVIDKNESERMASTVRHNRARGKHQITGMANIVFSMLDNGVTDAEICEQLGLEVEELIRLKHVTGFSKLFAETEYNKSWETRRQIRLKRDYDGE
tara:strand:+ start:1191 stop:1778 length:588 start_codon:yes stop_codon:yes gene_type:complete